LCFENFFAVFLFIIKIVLLLRKNQLQIIMEEIQLNVHNKQEYPPMHTAEHILNGTMTQMFGCPRSRNAHIERKKSKCDYLLPQPPANAQVEEIVRKVNEVIDAHLPVSVDFVSKEAAAAFLDLSKLPSETSEMIRVVRVGDYDTCACIGEHVHNTREIGKFVIVSHDFNEGVWRVRFKLEE